MQCMDNETAGTPPSWGLPLFTVHSIFQRSGDKEWLAKMYPLLTGYLDFWLVNRKPHDYRWHLGCILPRVPAIIVRTGTDAGGYQIAMCSWESGQDNGRRWGWADPENVAGVPGPLGGNGIIGGQVYGGDRSARTIRAPEHQAAMAYSAGVMAAFAKTLGKPASDVAKWRAVVDTHTNLTNSLYSKKHNWWCDFNSVARVWQTGCNDNGPESGVNGAGKEIMQMAPMFFHAPALGVDLLSGGPGVGTPALAELLTTVSDAHKMGTCEGCGKPIPGGTFRDGAWSSGGGSTWGPQPFLTISLAGNVNASAVASGITKRLVDVVWNTIDARSRKHLGQGAGDRAAAGSPYPGASYECWNLNTTNSSSGQPIPAMATACGAEDYSWTTEATTVTLIREVIGFREHHSFEADAFILRPALPHEWIVANGAEPAVFTVRDLAWRQTLLDIHFTPAASGLEGMLDVVVEESAAAESESRRRVAFSVRNAEDEMHVRVSVRHFSAQRQPASRVKHDDDTTPPPHLLSIIVDDLGWYDSQIHNPDSFMTENIGRLARQGITLMRHHTYFYCSPTRRSFLSGRLPVHITGIQAGMCTNYVSTAAPCVVFPKPKRSGCTAAAEVHPSTEEAQAGQPSVRNAHDRQGPPRLHHNGPPPSKQRI